MIFFILTAGAYGGSEKPSIFTTGTVAIEAQNATVELDVEIAQTQATKQLGLMGHTSLPEDIGLLFVHADPVVSTFTMRNTMTPLSVAFIDEDSRILCILDMQPCEAEPYSAYNPELTWTNALEVNHGAFGRFGVEVGDPAHLERS